MDRQNSFQFAVWFLLGTVLYGWLVPPVAAGQFPQKEYDVVKLAEGVYGVVWQKPFQDPVEGNSLIIINDRDVLVVDTGLFPSTALRVANEVKKLTSKPVRYVVNTHWHDDHHNGNQVYRELWPGVEFIGHHNTRTDAFSQTYNVRAKDLENTEQQAVKFEKWLAEGKDDAGTPLTERRRKRAGELVTLFRATIDELRTLRNTPPDLTITDSLFLHRGERTIEIRFLGLGNTRGDLVVFLPKERIAATGDLLVNPVPFGIGSYYKEWAATLGKVDSLPVDVLFPGHGAIQRNRDYLHNIQGLLSALVGRVDSAVNAGASLEATQSNVTLSDWKEKLAGDDPVNQSMFDNAFVAPAVERAWHQAKGEPDTVDGVH